MLYFGCVHFFKGINMKKIRIFSISFLLFLLFASVSHAEVNNPFTIKGSDEFTLEDKQKLEQKLQDDMNKKILSLENKMSGQIEEVKRSVATSQASRGSNTNSGGMNNSGPSGTGDDSSGGNSGPVVQAEEPIQTKVRKASFVGCIDDKGLFKDNKTKENFFVSIEEAKSNEEFNKMGGCSF